MSKLWEPGDRIEHWLVLERFLGGWGVVYALRDLRNTEGSVRPAVVAPCLLSSFPSRFRQASAPGRRGWLTARKTLGEAEE